MGNLLRAVCRIRHRLEHKHRAEVAVGYPEAHVGGGKLHHKAGGIAGKCRLYLAAKKLPLRENISDDLQNKLVLILEMSVWSGAGHLRGKSDATEREIPDTVAAELVEPRQDKSGPDAVLKIPFFHFSSELIVLTDLF
jgi:hypothetical protein